MGELSFQRKRKLQPKAAAAARAEQVAQAPAGGEPLHPALRARLEQRFGRDLSNVRVHSGPEAREAAGEIDAFAFTRGQHIYLASPRYAGDARLLSHELAHSVQQGAAPPLRLAAGAPAAARAMVPRAAPAPATAAAGPAPAVQRFDIWGAARRVGRGVASGVRAVGGAIAGAGERLLELGRDALLAVVRRVAPDFLPLFEGDGIAGFVRRLVARGLRSLFDGLLAPLRGMLDFGSIGRRVSAAASWMMTIAGQLARNDCSGITAAARRVGAFFSEALGPLVRRIRGIADKVTGFFRSIWEAIGAPIMDLLRRIGGAIWDSLRNFMRDVGRIIRRVRDALGRAWERVKGWFGIRAEEGESEGGGLWNWIRDKAASVGRRIAEAVRPVIGPLRTVGGVLLLIVPGGQILAVIALWPRLRQAWGWLSERWRELNLIPRARELLVNTVLPALMDAAESVAQALLRGADWLLGLLERVAGVLASAMQAAVGILSPLRRLIGFARQQFSRMVSWARSGLQYVSRNFRTLVQRLMRFLGVVLEVLRQVIAFVVNPFGIVGFLAGTLWRLCPDCLKGPLIDFILDILIRLVRAIPPLPLLGLLWPLIRATLIGFFERVRSFATERKVAVSNKIARIVSGMSPTFAFGYLRGLALGVWDGITMPFQAIAAIFELPGQIRGFLASLGLRLCDLAAQIRCFAAELAGRVFGSLDDILGALGELLQDPGRIVELIRCAIEGALAAAQSIGTSIADQLMQVLEGAEEAIGEQLGRVTGSVLVQAIIAYFTAGAGAAAGIIGQISRVLSTVGRAVGQVLRMLGRLVGRLVGFLRGLASRFAGAVARGGRGLLARLGGFFRRFANWLRLLLGRMFRGLRRRFGLTPQQRIRWLQFGGEARLLASAHPQGVRRRVLRDAFQRLVRRFGDVVKRPSFITKHGPHWRLWVRRVKSIRPRIVARVLLDHATREREGWKAVREAVRRIKRRPGLMRTADISRALPPIQRRFRFSSLSVSYDAATEDFAIHGEMSPGNAWRTDPERPPRNEVNAVVPGRHVVADPLVRASRTRSAPWGTPTGWGSIEQIKTRSGATSLYIKGHLVSGFFAGGGAENLTPLTRNANGEMASQIETPTKRLLRRRRNRPVFKYETLASGRAGARPQRRRVLSGSHYVWMRIPTERALARTVSVTRTEYGFDPSAGRWTRRKASVSVRVTNVANTTAHPPSGYPKGYRE